MLAPVMTMNEGEEIYSPGGDAPARLATGSSSRDSLQRWRSWPTTRQRCTNGALADRAARAVVERGGLITRSDLAAYAPRWTEPVEVDYAGRPPPRRAADLSGVPETVQRLPRLRGLDETGARARTGRRSSVARDGAGDTTNASVVDSDGNACVITSSLGLGSGDFFPGFDLHLNSMLGEADLLRGRARARLADGQHDGPDAGVPRRGSSSLRAPPEERDCAPPC